MKTNLTMKTKKLFFTFLTLLVYNGYSQNNNNPINTINTELSSWVEPMLTLFNTVIGLGVIIGGIIVFYKMKSAEGSEGRKALMTFLTAIAVAMFIRVLVGLFV